MGNPIIRYESGQTPKPFEEMTDSGDRTTFNASYSPISTASGEPIVAVYGLETGGAITPDTGSNDSVSVAALTVIAPAMAGADANGRVSVSAGDVAIQRGATTNTHRITSITVASDGTLTAVAGTAHTAFSETRGATGGPPYIPVGSVEIGQVRVTSTTAAEVVAGEIFIEEKLHREPASYGYNVVHSTGKVVFTEVLPAIHTGDKPAKVYIKGAVPVMSSLQYTSDWTGADVTYSKSSVDTHDGPVASDSTASVGDASFTVNNISEVLEEKLRALEGKTLLFEFRRDRDKLTNNYLTRGKFGTVFSYPNGGGNPSAACTITAETKTERVS